MKQIKIPRKKVENRCKNGTRRNPKTGNCEEKDKETPDIMQQPEQPALEPILIVEQVQKTMKKPRKKVENRCKNGTKRNPKTGKCE